MMRQRNQHLLHVKDVSSSACVEWDRIRDHGSTQGESTLWLEVEEVHGSSSRHHNGCSNRNVLEYRIAVANYCSYQQSSKGIHCNATPSQNGIAMKEAKF